MSYKTELQSNNIDIQTIENYVNEFGNLIARQDNLIAQIKTELQEKAIVGSGEPSVDDIGVFTIDDIWYDSSEDNGMFENYTYSGIKFLFIKGMTFQDYGNSILNQPFYNANKYLEMVSVGNYGLSIESFPVTNGIESSFAFSEDGQTFCNSNDIIKEIKYKMKSKFDS